MCDVKRLTSDIYSKILTQQQSYNCNETSIKNLWQCEVSFEGFIAIMGEIRSPFTNLFMKMKKKNNLESIFMAVRHF